MPKHHRTRKQRARRADPWADEITQVHEESCGLMRLLILWPHEALELFASAMAGNAESVRLVRVVADTLRRIAAAPPGGPLECGCCGRPLCGGEIICAAIPNRPDPTAGLAFALCQVCTRDADAVQGKAIEALRYLWPDGRLIEVTHPQGGVA